MKSHEKSWHRTIKDRIDFLDEISSLHKNGDYANFRQIESLRRNISGDNAKRANGELSYLLKNNPEILTENLDKIKDWDSFGNPVLQSFERENFKINCSDSVFPPLYDITKIKENLNLSSDFDIVEVGCGFGIEAKIFHDIVGYKSYTHVDLPDMLKLQSAYLSNFKTPNITYINPYKDIDKLKTHYDLFISNFAFTEITHDVQKFYFDNIIKKCSMGIIVGKMAPHIEGVMNNKITKVQIGWIESEFNIKYEKNSAYVRGGLIYFWK